MKHLGIVLLVCLGLSMPFSLVAQTLDQQLSDLKGRFDVDSVNALRPIVLKYATRLDELYADAIKHNNPQGAVAIQEALAELQRRTGVVVPPKIGAVPALPTVEDLQKAVADSMWIRKSDGATMTFKAKEATVATSWNGHGHWKVTRANRAWVTFNNGHNLELVFDPSLKKFTVDGKEVWVPAGN